MDENMFMRNFGRGKKGSKAIASIVYRNFVLLTFSRDKSLLRNDVRLFQPADYSISLIKFAISLSRIFYVELIKILYFNKF